MGKLLELLKYSSKTTKLAVSRPIKAGIRKIKKGLHFQSKIKKFTNETAKKIKGFLSGRPRSKDDYIRIGRKYYSKQVATIMIVILIAIPTLFVYYGIPAMKGRLWEASIKVNSNEMASFSGKAKVYAKDNSLIYNGELKEGRITGYGILYDKEGRMVYRGDFVNEEYSGYGEKYDIFGNLIYKGDFDKNQYNGYGELYRNNKIKYKGNFAAGEYNGKGILYNENKKVVYEGDFVNGKPEGNGTFYDEHNNIIYSGQNVDGKYTGVGTVYHSNGYIKYEGTLNMGLYNGEGKLYNEHGGLIYEGSFRDGKFDGKGTIYYESGKVRHVGEYSQGEFSGEGKLYDEITGKQLYEGEFAFGKYEGTGIVYNLEGRKIYEGELKAGEYYGAGTLFSNSGAVLYNGDFYSNEIDYYSYIGLEITELRNSFGEEDSYYMLSNGFIIYYEELGVAVYSDFVDSTQTPIVSKITLLKNQSLLNTQRGMISEDLIENLGKEYEKEYVTSNEEHLKYLTLLSELHDTDYGEYSMYKFEYTFKNFKIIYYINDNSEEILFYQIREV